MTTSISIYGVGRSGTKLTQLVTCMALARQYHMCDLSYEPFYWANRHCTQVSIPGISTAPTCGRKLAAGMAFRW